MYGWYFSHYQLNNLNFKIYVVIIRSRQQERFKLFNLKTSVIEIFKNINFNYFIRLFISNQKRASGDGNIHLPHAGDGKIHMPHAGDGNTHMPQVPAILTNPRASGDGNTHMPQVMATPTCGASRQKSESIILIWFPRHQRYQMIRSSWRNEGNRRDNFRRCWRTNYCTSHVPNNMPRSLIYCTYV